MTRFTCKFVRQTQNAQFSFLFSDFFTKLTTCNHSHIYKLQVFENVSFHLSPSSHT